VGRAARALWKNAAQSTGIFLSSYPDFGIARDRVSGWNIFRVDSMTFVVGKRCKPILLYVVLVVVALSLVYFCMHRGGDMLPQNAPLHQN